MKGAKKEKPKAAGWRVGTAEEFIGLPKQEAAFAKMKLALAGRLRRRPQAKRLTQTQLARRIGSSQSRAAKMEAADPSVSVDLRLKAPLPMGARRSELARIIRKRCRRPA